MENLDNPFLAFDKIYEIIKPSCDIIFVDFHAEATSEKIAFSYYATGRADVVAGTHTHVQTADERIINYQTAAITDVGMTGPYECVIGIDKNIIIKSFKTKRPVKFELAEGIRQFNGICVTFDQNNVCVKIERIYKIFD
jgi:metallophosphoesterase (TIGR00282 family)